MQKLTALDDQLYLFDLLEQNQAGRSSAYLYLGQKKALIETGSSLSHQAILDALREASISPNELDYILLTHIHLDHAGGAGHLARLAPQARVVAHPRAKRHLMDPSRLMAGAKSVYGDALHELFGDMIAIPEEQLLIRHEGEQIDLGDRVWTFYDTPGHAKHHFSIYDERREAIFSGDALGIRYVTSFTGYDFEFVMPSTSPSDFDPSAVEQTVRKLRALRPKTVFHTHFGPSPAEEAFAGTEDGVKRLAQLAKTLYYEGASWEEYMLALTGLYAGILNAAGHASLDIEKIGIDLELNAKGLLHWAAQQHAQ
ncbi:MBL fold metallo-hydrolase [Ferroacidibacillus organovorans]|uniref:Metallo-beta-lactamase domain-containing protein n=1 Tax=Ferroacidibacillus organovorans TaxID=1765683 RepID=A0A101XQP6_9BACL|nr:MBL fold metallo-hydrolase [Ferroacidibacillus organovorans]KUO95754.1 hypothetical protein ATW55_05320 [Ferroacidibacillus organovorans]